MTQVDGQHVSVFPSEIDIRVKASAPIIHAVGGSDSSGCTPGNNPTYLQLFFFLLLLALSDWLLHDSCHGLQSKWRIPSWLPPCFVPSSGHDISFCEASFSTYMQFRCILCINFHPAVFSCHFLPAFTSTRRYFYVQSADSRDDVCSLDSQRVRNSSVWRLLTSSIWSLCQHSRGHKSVNKTWPLTREAQGNVRRGSSPRTNARTQEAGEAIRRRYSVGDSWMWSAPAPRKPLRVFFKNVTIIVGQWS